MAIKTGALVASSVFTILAVCVGGDLMVAKSAANQPGGYQTEVSAPPTNVRVILPYSASDAHPPQQPVQQAAIQSDATQPTLQPAKKAGKSVQAAQDPKSGAEDRASKRRYAERKAKRESERARKQRDHEHPFERELVPVMAYSGGG